jgi:hypothetical protein
MAGEQRPAGAEGPPERAFGFPEEGACLSGRARRAGVRCRYES